MVSDLCGIYPDFRLHIAGSGPDESKIKQLTQELKIRSNCVIFHGYLSERSGELKEIVGKSALCLALYRDDPDGFMQYTEPAKAKLYLSYGTPVLMTRVPDLAAEFEKNKVGISADFSRDSIKQSIVKFLGDKKLQQSIRKNIPVYIRKFDTKNLLKKAMNDFIKTIKESEK
jgi:glycosyltransferase involved in cell wall biosynthesis